MGTAVLAPSFVLLFFWKSSTLFARMAAVVNVFHKFLTAPQATSKNFCNVIKLGTFCRTVVWPCLPAVMMLQYIRLKDEDMYTTEVLYYKSGSNDAKAFYDTARVGNSGHWRMQQDLEIIRAGANPERGVPCTWRRSFMVRGQEHLSLSK